MSDVIQIPDTPEYADATRSQAQAADPALSAWVAANAGSGKTKVLIDRVARLLLGDADPGSILCVTYTKAAANEMLGRLFERLGSWAVMPEEKLRAALIDLDPSTETYGDDDIRRARALFARALETPGGLRIETIHAFCSRILRRFPLEANVAPGFQEIEDEDANELWDDAVKRAVIDAGRDIPEELDVLSLAGGAFGAKGILCSLRKATATIAEFAILHQDSEHGMAQTIRTALRAPDTSRSEFISKQMARVDCDGLRAILPALLASDKKTDHQSAAVIQFALDAEHSDQKWSAIYRLFFTQKGSPRKSIYTGAVKKDPNVVALLSVTDDLGSVARIALETNATLKAIQAANNTIALIRAGIPALEHYADFKASQAALDFDDLILKTRELLTQAGVAAWVLYKLDGGLEHILLDEAQDTSPFQWDLINALTEEFYADLSREHSQNPRTLFVVGDEKQSIYSFQGADPAKFIEERQRFVSKSLQGELAHALPEMQMSFRSSPEILQFVDAVWNASPTFGTPFAKDPPVEADLTCHTARRVNQPGFVEFWPVALPRTEVDETPWTPFSNIKALDELSAHSPKAELAARIADEVAAMLERGDSVWQRKGFAASYRRKMHPGDVLILVRKRKGGLFDALIKALKAKEIPVAGADRLVLADHIGVQDCLNLIRFALLPSDDLTLAEILRGPFCGLVDDDAHLFALAHKRTGTLWDALQASADPEHIHAKALLSKVLDMRSMPPYEFLNSLLVQRANDGQTGWDKITYRLGLPARDPVEALLSRALAHDAQSASSLQIFLADLELDESEIKRDLEEAGEAVRVMTVHGAKGLQAPVVILPDTTSDANTKADNILQIDADRVPVYAGHKTDDTPEMAAARTEVEERALLEHRRLLYVALTRAQDRLLICGPWHGTKPKGDTTKSGRGKLSWHAMCEAGLKKLGIDVQSAGGKPVTYGTAPPPLEQNDLPCSENVALPDWLQADAPKIAETRRYVAPSSLAPGNAPVFPPFKKGHGIQLNRGRLIHALLQRLPDIPANERKAAGAAFLSTNPDLSASQRNEMLNAALNVLNHPEFADVFQLGGRAEAPVIGTSPDLPPGTVLNGRVDRLVITDQDVFIIDFKTDRPPPSDPKDVGASYVLQMAAYRAVLREAYPLKKVRCALLWTAGPQLMELPENQLLEALKDLNRGL